MKKYILYFVFLLAFFEGQTQELVINEVSQGEGGAKEYVEFVVAGPTGCGSNDCMDLRGWYFDDNNGTFAKGSGTGIAQGCLRFADSAQWACVQIGSLIIIYNDADYDASLIPPIDTNDANGDFVYVLPVSSSLFEGNENYPSSSNGNYPTTGFQSGGLWKWIGMKNGDDSFQIRDPNDLSKPSFSVSWGNNTDSTIIYFSGSASKKVMRFTNSVSDDWRDQNNWDAVDARDDGNQTPGKGNTPENTAWIESMRAYKEPNPDIVGDTVFCEGDTSTLDVGPFAHYNWNTGDTTQTIDVTASGLYKVSIIDSNGCPGEDSVTVIVNSSEVHFNQPLNQCLLGNEFHLDTSGNSTDGSYSWDFGDGTSDTGHAVTHTYADSGSYIITLHVSGNGCGGSESHTVTVYGMPQASIKAYSNPLCHNDTNGWIVAQGGASYDWSPNGYSGDGTDSLYNLPAGTYTVIVASSVGCKDTAYQTLTNPNELQTTLQKKDIRCHGLNDGNATVTITQTSTSPYNFRWSSGDSTINTSNTTDKITHLSSGNYSITVSDNNGCADTTSFSIAEPPQLVATITDSTDVTCHGDCDGGAKVVASGGIPNYSYEWSSSPKQTTDTAKNLCAATYTVTIKDDSACEATAIVTIHENTAVEVHISDSTMVSCNGYCDGDATASASGGTNSFTYLWSIGDTTAKTDSLCAGTYTLTVTDANGCKDSTSVTITENPPLSAPFTTNNATCHGICDGDATVSASGGTGTYSYQWDDAKFQTTATADSLCNGTYHVTVKDDNDCKIIDTITINEPVAISLTPHSNNATCGNNNGSAWVDASGGTGTLHYDWTPDESGDGTDSIYDLTSGNYMVVVKDDNDCKDSVTISVNDDGAPSATITSHHDVSCNGKCDGDATVSATGGTGTYSYSWSNGDTTTTADSLCATTISVTVTDGNNCNATTSIDIHENPPLNASITDSANVTCYGDCDGWAKVQASGGTGIYSYQWDDGASQTTDSAISLCAGTYHVTVSDTNHCTSIDSVFIEENPAVSAVISNYEDASAAGKCDGWAVVTATGGTGTYTYQWDDGASQTTDSAINLCAGTYHVTVQDEHGCEDSTVITIGEPGALSLSTTTQDVLCYGDSNGFAVVTATGGVTPYRYVWSNGDTTDTAKHLPAGSYTVTVTDNNGADAVTSVHISQNDKVVASINHIVHNTCYGSCDGQAIVHGEGGTKVYSYTWETGTDTLNDSTAIHLCAQRFHVTVTDTNHCSDTTSVLITQPDSLHIDFSSIDALCYNDHNGSATATVSGGNGGYSYSWSNSDTTATADSLSAGIYVLTIHDNHTCTKIDSVEIHQPLPLSVSIIESKNVRCYGESNGQAIASTTGGTSAYTYQWSDGKTDSVDTTFSAGTYTVTVTDANHCKDSSQVVISEPSQLTVLTNGTDETCSKANGFAVADVSGGTKPYSYLWDDASSQTTDTALHLTANDYHVTITDSNACHAYGQITIQNHAGQTLTITNKKMVGCYGDSTGSATVSISGGTTPFVIAWSDGSTEATADSLPAGLYFVTVTDSNNCVATDSVIITQPDSLSASVNNVLLKCHGDTNATFFVTDTGGTLPYHYQWNTSPIDTLDSLANQSAGTYTVTVTDANHCQITVSGTATEPSAMSISDSLIQPSCGGSDGSIDITVTGGNSTTYSYQWTDNDTINETTEDLTNIPANTYYLTVTDSKGCHLDTNYQVNDEGSPTATISAVTHDKCYHDKNGSATVSGTGGAQPYSYLWSTGDTTATIANVDGGTYSVTIFDTNGCKATAIATIEEPTKLDFIYSTVDNKCNGDCQGIATVTPYGGTPPYTYDWGGAGDHPSDSVNTGLCAGTYPIRIKDAHDCDTINNDSIKIAEPPILSLTTSHTNVTCHGNNDGTATVIPTGGTPGYTYVWSANANSQTTPTATGLKGDTYSVTVTDSNNCEQTITVTVDEPAPLQFETINIQHLTCHNSNDGSISSSAKQGTPPYSYHWEKNTDTSWSASLSDINHLEATTYYLTITDSNGCSIDTSVAITAPSELSLTLDAYNEKCAGACDGHITAYVSGGTSADGSYAYQWSNGKTTATVDSLCPHMYAVTVHDDNNCSIKDSVEITGPEPLKIYVTQKEDATCGNNNGSITIALSGGTGTPTISWNNGTTTVNNTNLDAGNYCVTITDSNDCKLDTCISISNSDGPTIDTILVYDVSCSGYHDGALKLYLDSSTSDALPYSITWNTGDTTDSIDGLSATTYHVTVTDTNHCSAVQNATIQEPSPIVILADSNAATCHGTCNGTIALSVTGGVSPYSYSWNNSDSTASIDSLCAGTYTVTITDANTCRKQRTVTIEEPDPILITLNSLKNKSCYDKNDGTISVTASGGSSPYYYHWTPTGETTPSIGGLDSGIYTVVVSSQNDTACKIDSSFFIASPQQIIVFTGSIPVTCNQDNGLVYIDSITGGTPPYTWQWSPCSGSCGNDTLYNLAEGVYQVQVTDSLHCEVIENDTVSHIDVVKIDSVETTDVLCYNGTDGVATVYSNGIAGPPYSYTWQLSNGTTTTTSDSTKTDLIPSHDYIVTITDTNGCTDSRRFGIDQPNELFVHLDGPSSPICIGQSTLLSATGSGGTPSYTYIWLHDTTVHSQTLTVSPSVTTTYRVQVRDSNGCLSPIESMTVVVYPPLSVILSNPDTICEGDNATITAVAGGGNGGPYSYLWSTGSSENPVYVSPLQTTSYSVTIQDQCGTPPAADTTQVIVNPLPRLLTIDNASGCEPLNVTFHPSIYATDGTPTYQWFFYDQIGSGSLSTDSIPTHTYVNSGVYDVGLTLISSHGCKYDTLIPELVSVYPIPNASFTMDPQSAGVFDAEIQFFDNSEPDIARWYWSFGDTSYSMVQNPIHTFQTAGTFTVNLIVSSSHDCYDTASVQIYIKPEHTFYAPTAFSPGTGYSNNYWYPKGIGIDGNHYHFWIYDRWGQVIYDTDVKPDGTEMVVEKEGGWNGRYRNTGKMVPPDTYVWLVILYDINGEAHEYSGTVTVVK